jgi:hypothetical protein
MEPLELGDYVQVPTYPISYGKITALSGAKATVELANVRENRPGMRGMVLRSHVDHLSLVPTRQRIEEETQKFKDGWTEAEERQRRGTSLNEHVPYYLPGTEFYDPQPGTMSEDDENLDDFLLAFRHLNRHNEP